MCLEVFISCEVGVPSSGGVRYPARYQVWEPMAPMWHHPWGNSRMVDTGFFFCGKLFQLKLCPQRLPFWHSRLKAQFMCNKVKAHDPLKCPPAHTYRHAWAQKAQGHTDAAKSYLGREPGQTWEGHSLSYPKHFSFSTLHAFSLDPHRLLLDHPLLTNTW